MKLKYEIRFIYPEGTFAQLEKKMLEAKYDGMKEFCRKAALNLRTEARAMFKTSEGHRLEKSITYKVDKSEDGAEGTIRMFKYGKIIELGRRGRGSATKGKNIRPNPWISNTLEKMRAKGVVTRIFRKHIDKKLDELSKIPRTEKKVKK